MPYIKNFILAFSLLFAMNAYSQNVPFTLEDLIPGGKKFRSYLVDVPQRVQWHEDKLTYVKGDSIVYITPKSSKPEKFITLGEINAILQKAGEKPISTIYQITEIFSEANVLIVKDKINTYLIDIKNNTISSRFENTNKLENTDFNLYSKTFAYTKGNNLYIKTNRNKDVQITNERDTNIVCGQSIHQNEFGIKKGTFWSPKGNLLAFYQMDQTMVTDYPLVNVASRIASVKNKKYPMAGMKSHHVTIGVYNRSNGKTTFLNTGTPKEKYLTNIAWSPDEKYIYVAELNRGQDTCILNRYNATTGKLEKHLFTETHPKWVEPENPILFVKNDTTKFIWQSKHDGYNHLYLYSTDGTFVKQITTGNWDVTSVIGFDEKGEHLIYTSTEQSPIENHIYKLNLKNGKTICLSKEEGVHEAWLSPDGKYLYDRYSSQNNPSKSAIIEIKANKSFIFNEAENPFQNRQLPEISLGTIKANDGKTDLYYRIVKPLDFDLNKKYPVIVYVYGGPHLQLITNSFMGGVRGWDIYMAQKGYLVFTLDNRGTPNRGFEFENIIHRQLGIVETQDQMSGIEFLKSQSYVDANRIGVHGWSYGGFMTLNLMLRHPETFKVGVAGGSVTDWKYYEIMYGERYMDSPKENPDGYKETSMADRAGDLQGRVMLIHGDEDPVVVMQHSMQFLNSAIKKGTHPDFFVYPGHEHNVYGRDRIHLYEHITRYFDDFLK